MTLSGAHYKILVLVGVGHLFNIFEQLNVAYAGPILIQEWGLSQAANGALTTATYLGIAVGGTIAGILSDRFGRRQVFMANFLLFTLGALVAAFAPNYAILFLARILVGLGLGGEITLGFTVMAEMTPTQRRGAMVAALNVVASVGLLAASGVAALMFGPLLEFFGGSSYAWRWYFGVMVLPAFVFLWLRRYLPETPRYLLRRGRVAESNRILTLLSGGSLKGRADTEVREFIQGPEGVPARENEVKTRVRELFAGEVRRRTIIAALLWIGMAGGSVVYFISLPTILGQRGVSVDTSLLLATISNVAGVFGALAGVWAAHRFARRAVYIVTIGTMLAAALAMASVPNVALTLTFAIVISFMLQIMVGNHLAYMPELFPTRVRATGAGLTASVGTAASALAPLAGGALADSFGVMGPVLLLAGLFVVMIVTALFAPETAGKHLTEITAEESAHPGRASTVAQ
ncbi:MFS transporter [Pseudonocardia halophobica]|uniref:MFS transporter n=1 Tax=Pseudonocardia halophobica TaxID=29401 RepID=A0A9W6NVL3_9PSEU|nr:MFS transporter [Pseudonocardia halophobica]GLL10527.1 MFS transporter [Pseudonocardia halophobica]